MIEIKYCLPIQKASKDEVIQTISENPDYDFYEIWLSYIKDLDTDFIWKISNELNGKLIFLFRKQNLEKSDLDKETKEKIIKLVEKSDNFLDLDINDQKDELDFIKSDKLANKLIVSYHNYEETLKLESIVEEVKKLNPEIIKVSTFCKEDEDSIKLLQILLELKKEGKKFIVLGMGEKGKIVRILGAVWGNEINFAPLSEEEKSAPGQITREKLSVILNVVKDL